MSSVADKLRKKNPRQPKSTMQVRLKLVRINLWSSAKVSFLIGISLGVFVIVGTLVAWTILSRTGAFDQLDALISGVTPGAGTSVKSLLSPGRVMGFAVIVALLNLVVITVAGTIATLLYNLSVKFTGGLFIGFVNK
ncbi:MAG TPA: hypothetical protein DCP11_00590 [Microbacteriaceae bacterium]|jgi:hypothetical protein|nr:hypothetical protein [Microbacteriaceae bacterium]